MTTAGDWAISNLARTWEVCLMYVLHVFNSGSARVWIVDSIRDFERELYL